MRHAKYWQRPSVSFGANIISVISQRKVRSFQFSLALGILCPKIKGRHINKHQASAALTRILLAHTYYYVDLKDN
jgi:hypothetical protein